MAAQAGKGAKFYRGSNLVLKCIEINPPIPTIPKIDASNLDSTAKEYVPGLADFPEIEVKAVRLLDDSVQNAIESEFLAGTNPPSEAWKYEIRDPTTGTLLKTYSFNGYISAASTGPLSVDALVTLNFKVQLSGGVTVT